jgi:hypothetical protein
VPEPTGEQAGAGHRLPGPGERQATGAGRPAASGRPSSGAGLPPTRLGRLERRLSWLYLVCAAGLIPWIVVLYRTQVPHAKAHQVHLLAAGLLLAAMASLLVTAWLSLRDPALAVIAGSFAGTVTFISVWFRSLTRAANSGMTQSTPLFIVLVLAVIVVCGVAVGCELRAARQGAAPPPWLPLLLVLAAAALVPLLVFDLTLVPAVQVAHHLKIAWTGLDIFECVALAATGLALRHRPQSVLAPATVTAALLLCDAWINVIPSSGAARAEGIVLAFIEVPVAALSLWVALRAARRPGGTSDPAGMASRR